MNQILDYAGRPVKPLKGPDTREIAAVSIRDRWSGYPSAGLTPALLTSIFREADWGYLRTQAELFEEMEEKDAHLFAVMQTRRLAVLGLDWQVEAAAPRGAAEKKTADFCREQLEGLNLQELFLHLLGAVGHGYAAAEILWQNGGAEIGGFRNIHPKNITFVNSLAPLVVTEANNAGEEPPPFKLVFHRYLAKSGHDTRNGVLRVCAYMYLFKNYALKDWATFNEVFGMPLRLGKYDPSASPEDRDALRQAIVNLGTDAAGIISKSTEIEFVEAAQRMSGVTNPYQVLALFCNREMSKAVLGQTLTTDTEGATGTYAAGLVQAEVRRDLLEADARALARTVRDQILRPLVAFNFGWDAPMPGFSFLLQQSPDLKADSEVCKNLAAIGFSIPQAWIAEHFGIPLPQAGEATATPPIGPGGQAQGLRAIMPLRNGAGLELLPQDAQVIRTHGELENLAQAALQASAEALTRLLLPVRELIERAASLEEIRDGLLAAYPRMESTALAETLHQAMVLANLRGRLARDA